VEDLAMPLNIRNRTAALVSATLALVGIAVGVTSVRAPEAAAASCPWVGSTAPVAQRVGQVLAQMTLADKIAMVHGVSGSYVGVVPANPALCIPALNLQDGPAGVGDGLGGVTQLPAPVAVAASWDTGLAQQYGSVLGAEQAGKGVNVELGPTINIVRDPRWGRAFESLGEDPYLAGQIGSADIQGIQGQGVLAQVKHFAVYNQETNRNTSADNAVVDQRTEQEIYLPAFQAAVQQGGAASVMCSYSVVNGTPACDNSYLQNTVLRGQFGFPGFVTSDWGAQLDGVQAATNGLDMEMPDGGTFGAPLQTAVQNGQVTTATLNTMVSRILTEMFDFGLFDKAPTGSPGATVTTPAHVATAKQVATDGSVLLKNSGNALPLNPTGSESIAVIGDDAQAGALTAGGGSAGVSSSGTVTPLQGITNRVAPTNQTKVTASAYTTITNAQTESTTDTGGGQDVGYINNTSSLSYAGVNFGSGASSVQLRMASALSGQSGTVQLRLDSATATPFATIPVTGTGGWQNWVTTPAVTASPAPSGTHTVYVTFSSPQTANFVNLNWLGFGAGTGPTVRYAQGATSNGALTAVDPTRLAPATGSGQGLYGQYYNNTTLSGTPVLSRVDQNYQTNYNGASPAPGVNATGWSAKWTGTVNPTVTGTYYFSTTADDGVRLSVNGQQVINDWRDQGTTTTDASVNLTAGQPVSIELDYYQNGGGSTLALGWQPPDANSLIQQAVTLAKSSSVAVVFAGDDESEGSDLPTIDLPGLQNQLIEAVAAANPNTVVVLNTGSAVTMPWLSSVAGVMESWYPGQQDGAATAALLFGDVNPSGKLPVTFPKSLTDVPANTAAQWPGVNGTVQYSEGLDVGYRWYQAKNITPLFPFGFGLSYTSFSFSGLSITPGTGTANGPVTVTANVTNTGTKSGSEVAQLYVGHPSSAGEPPHDLAGFAKVALNPGQTQKVTFTLTNQALRTWNDSTSNWTTATGAYQLAVGDSATNLPLTGTYTVTGSSNPTTVTASKYSSTQNTGVETTTDTGGGQDVGWINNTSQLAYTNVNFGTGISTVQARLASDVSGTPGQIQLRIDSPTATPFATIPVTGTGGWQNWVTSPAVATSPKPTGTHTLYVTFTSPQSANFVNLNWLQLNP
jgi:beta-glucosidase-like glycosyl hydrolase